MQRCWRHNFSAPIELYNITRMIAFKILLMVWMFRWRYPLHHVLYVLVLAVQPIWQGVVAGTVRTNF